MNLANLWAYRRLFGEKAKPGSRLHIPRDYWQL
jgi:hypothetical protein